MEDIARERGPKGEDKTSGQECCGAPRRTHLTMPSKIGSRARNEREDRNEWKGRRGIPVEERPSSIRKPACVRSASGKGNETPSQSARRKKGEITVGGGDTGCE